MKAHFICQKTALLLKFLIPARFFRDSFVTSFAPFRQGGGYEIGICGVPCYYAWLSVSSYRGRRGSSGSHVPSREEHLFSADFSLQLVLVFLKENWL